MKITKTKIAKTLPTSTCYGVQIRGDKFYRWFDSKAEAARVAYCNASDGWPTKVKTDAGDFQF